MLFVLNKENLQFDPKVLMFRAVRLATGPRGWYYYDSHTKNNSYQFNGCIISILNYRPRRSMRIDFRDSYWRNGELIRGFTIEVFFKEERIINKILLSLPIDGNNDNEEKKVELVKECQIKLFEELRLQANNEQKE